jgi:hypothetical protein
MRYLILLLISIPAHAGVFLDLDIGTHVFDYPEDCGCMNRWISNKNPIGQLRVGYEKSLIKRGKFTVYGHGFYQHTSSMKEGDDTGIDFYMVGTRLEYEL